MTGDRQFRARAEVRHAIRRLAKDSGGETVTRPVIRSEPGGPAVLEPEPLAAVTAAADLARWASAAIREHARAAREDGCTWRQVGEALGPEREGDIASHAFGLLAADLGGGPSFAWTCPSCLKTVIDYGPEAGNPEDQERGHAEGCERFAETVRAWNASWDDGTL